MLKNCERLIIAVFVPYLIALSSACFLPQHHCHICWGVVCDACSKHKIPISDPSSKPERVCDVCFNKLSTLNESENNYCCHLLTLVCYVATYTSQCMCTDCIVM